MMLQFSVRAPGRFAQNGSAVRSQMRGETALQPASYRTTPFPGKAMLVFNLKTAFLPQSIVFTAPVLSLSKCGHPDPSNSIPACKRMQAN
jgi:hypothetical protein